MNNQEFFTKTVQHLRRQGEKAFLPGDDGCAYRTRDGKMCAVGCHITAEQYDDGMEGYRATAMLADYKLPQFDGVNDDLIRCMQSVHDRFSVSVWEHEFGVVAKTFCLQLPPLEATPVPQDTSPQKPNQQEGTSV